MEALMKKLLFIFLFTFLSICFIQATLLNESFEGTWLPEMWTLNAGAGYETVCWQKITAGGIIGDGAFYTGSASAGIYGNGAISSWEPHNDFLITPELTPDAVHHAFTFHAKQYLDGYSDHFQVFLRYAASPFTFVMLDTDAWANTYWTTYSYDLSAYEGIPIYISIRAYGLYSNGLLLVDDVMGPEVTGTPEPPVLYALPNFQNFGYQRLGTQSAETNFYLGNTGGSVLSITNISIEGTDRLNFNLYDTHTYPLNIMSMNDTIIVHVRFNPISTDAKTASLRIDYGADGFTNLPLYGTGVDSDEGGIFYPSQTEAYFGQYRQATSSANLYFAVYNVGTGDLTIDNVAIVGPDALEFNLTDTNSYPNTIEFYNPSLPIDFLSVQVAFAPTSTGSKTAFLRFTDSYGANHDISLTGECVLYLPMGVPYYEYFDWEPLATEWSITDVSGTAGDWALYLPGIGIPDCEPYSGSGCIRFNSSTASSGRTRFESGQLLLESYLSARLEFWMYHDNSASSADDRVTVQYDTGTEIWHNTALTVNRYQSGTPGWTKYVVDLSPIIGINTGRIGFLGISENGNDMYIDEVQFLISTPTPETTYISEVCDNLPGQPASTGFIEITSKVPYAQNISDYRIRRGYYDEYGSFGLDDPEITYFIPAGTILYPGSVLIIGNGADEATFKAAWGITGPIHYLSGDAALDITCGKAYELWSYVHPERDFFEGTVDASPLVAIGQDAVHSTSGWAFSDASSGTPGSTGGSAVLSAPPNITVLSSGADLELHWDSVDGAIGYFIYNAPTPQGPWGLKTYKTGTQLIHAQTDSLAVEFFRVKATPDSIQNATR